MILTLNCELRGCTNSLPCMRSLSLTEVYFEGKLQDESKAGVPLKYATSMNVAMNGPLLFVKSPSSQRRRCNKVSECSRVGSLTEFSRKRRLPELKTGDGLHSLQTLCKQMPAAALLQAGNEHAPQFTALSRHLSWKL